jgi:hypothetical protein
MENPLIKVINEFYEDTSRQQSQTAAGLLDAKEHIETLLETLPETDEGFMG